MPVRAAAVVVFALSLVACDLGKQRPPVELSSVADAPKHHEATRLRFRGTARPDLMGEERWVNRPQGRGASGASTKMAMFVVPVVPEGWTETQPVPLWVSAPSSQTDPAGWLDSLAEIERTPIVGKVMDYAGREPGMRTQSGWQRAIEDAEGRYGIRSDPHAPVVLWPE